MSEADPQAQTIAAQLEATANARSTSPAEEPALLAGRYEVLGMLGAGAMGTVYRARDRELEEVVALKVLKKELATYDMVERFRREVKLARRVTHRNVARTYDIGEHSGDRFLTMEFVEGEMLGALLARRVRLPLDEVVRIAVDICAGLAAAHAAGVLHRDLKPENVIIAKDGRAVITDFGIARAYRQPDHSRTVGGIVGTPAYMAPEQVEGAPDLDARADLYALGTMLFELLTGELAWKGDSVVTVAAGRLLRPPPDPRSVVPQLPEAAAAVVLKLMARRREERFASASETSAALEALAVAPRPPSSGTLPLLPRLTVDRRSTGARVVAVLPVSNLGSSEDAYLVDNVNEDVVDLLSVVPGLLVRPRAETSRFGDPKRDVREIGRGVGADVVVDGSLRRIGDVVRVTFRVISVEDGFQLWAKRFERPPAEILAIADDAAHAVARALTTELAQTKARSADPEAEDLFLRGRFLMRRGWMGAIQEAVQLLGRAHARSPDDARIAGTYALALARAYGNDSGPEVAEKARLLAEQAINFDPSQPEAKVALATVHFHNQEGESAVRWFRVALAASPNSVEALDWLGRLVAEIGRVDEGLGLLQRAVANDPESMQARFQIARIRGMLGDRAAMVAAAGAMPTHPADLAAWFMLFGRPTLWNRDRAGAHDLLERLRATTIPDGFRAAVEGLLSVAEGTFPLEQLTPELVARMLPLDPPRTPRRASFNAQMRTEVYAFIGRPEAALDALRAADECGLVDVVWLERCPLLDPLRRDPGFVAVSERIRQRAKRVATALDHRYLP